MMIHRKLRLVPAPDEEPVMDGDLAAVLDDLATAKGMTVEASAEAEACPQATRKVKATLAVAGESLDQAIMAVHEARSRT